MFASHPFVILFASHPFVSLFAYSFVILFASHPFVILFASHPFVILFASHPFVILFASHPFVILSFGEGSRTQAKQSGRMLSPIQNTVDFVARTREILRHFVPRNDNVGTPPDGIRPYKYRRFCCAYTGDSSALRASE